MTESDGVLARIEPWSGRLFLIAGALLVVHAGHHGLEAFAGIEYPLHHEAPFGAAGMILGFVGLLGLYPRLAARTPKLAAAGAIAAGIGAIGWFAGGVRALAEDLGAQPPAWLEVSGLAMLLGVVLAYLAFGVAGLRSDAVSRTSGLALLTPLLVMAMNVSIVAAGYASLEGQFAVASGFALAHLAIGIALGSDGVSTGRGEPRPAEV